MQSMICIKCNRIQNAQIYQSFCEVVHLIHQSQITNFVLTANEVEFDLVRFQECIDGCFQQAYFFMSSSGRINGVDWRENGAIFDIQETEVFEEQLRSGAQFVVHRPDHGSTLFEAIRRMLLMSAPLEIVVRYRPAT